MNSTAKAWSVGMGFTTQEAYILGSSREALWSRYGASKSAVVGSQTGRNRHSFTLV